MTSWLPSLPSLPFSFRGQPTPVVSQSHDQQARPRSPVLHRRFPTPPNRGSSPTSSALPSTERQWLPRSSSYGEDGEMPLQQSVSPTRATANLDTPRSYLDRAASARDIDPSRPPIETRRSIEDVYQEENEEEDRDRPTKKRKGLAGQALSTVLDGAIFATALSYSAYQLWRHPPELQTDIDNILKQRAITNGSIGVEHEGPPPPYSAAEMPTSSQSDKSDLSPSSASQVPRRVRHVHERRPRPSTSRRSSPLPNATPSDSTSKPMSYDPFASSHLNPFPLPEFQPFVKSEEDGDESFGEDDTEMKAVADRLKGLIENGREALLSRPVWEPTPVEPSRPPVFNPVEESRSTPSRIPTKNSAAPSPRATPMSRFANSLPTAPSGTPTSFSKSSTSASSHIRRQSTNSFSSPAHHLTPNRPGSSFLGGTINPGTPRAGRSSLGGSGHTPRSSKWGSMSTLEGMQEGTPTMVSRNAKALVGALEQTAGSGMKGKKGWWEEEKEERN